jgi:hypothetical protein
MNANFLPRHRRRGQDATTSAMWHVLRAPASPGHSGGTRKTTSARGPRPLPRAAAGHRGEDPEQRRVLPSRRPHPALGRSPPRASPPFPAGHWPLRLRPLLSPLPLEGAPVPLRAGGRDRTGSSSSQVRRRAAPSLAQPTFIFPDKNRQLYPGHLWGDSRPQQLGRWPKLTVEVWKLQPRPRRWSSLEPAPSVGRANRSAQRGWGWHVTRGAGRRPAARAAGRGRGAPARSGCAGSQTAQWSGGLRASGAFGWLLPRRGVAARWGTRRTGTPSAPHPTFRGVSPRGVTIPTLGRGKNQNSFQLLVSLYQTSVPAKDLLSDSSWSSSLWPEPTRPPKWRVQFAMSWQMFPESWRSDGDLWSLVCTVMSASGNHVLRRWLKALHCRESRRGCCFPYAKEKPTKDFNHLLRMLFLIFFKWYWGLILGPHTARQALYDLKNSASPFLCWEFLR